MTKCQAPNLRALRGSEDDGKSLRSDDAWVSSLGDVWTGQAVT